MIINRVAESRKSAFGFGVATLRPAGRTHCSPARRRAMKVHVGATVKRPGSRGPTPLREPDPKAVKECAMELRKVGDLLNFLHIMLNTVGKMFQLST